MITVVSGLPRSGTSLMMQMLEQGGMDVLSDGIRKPDESNLRGYYEFEKVKKLDKDNSWMPQAEGKVVKIIAQLLRYLPAEHDYRIVFMERDITEVMKSQEAMLEALNRPNTAAGSDALARTFARQVDEVKDWLAKQPNMHVLYVGHQSVVARPAEEAHKINEFLGGALNEEAMAAAVDPKLYRQRLHKA